jgi:hypothetical protein
MDVEVESPGSLIFTYPGRFIRNVHRKCEIIQGICMKLHARNLLPIFHKDTKNMKNSSTMSFFGMAFSCVYHLIPQKMITLILPSFEKKNLIHNMIYHV